MLDSQRLLCLRNWHSENENTFIFNKKTELYNLKFVKLLDIIFDSYIYLIFNINYNLHLQ